MPEASTMTETKPKRRWLRFSLRTFLLAVMVLCIWLGFKVNAVRRQKEGMAAILRAGGTIGFNYQLAPAVVPAGKTISDHSGHLLGSYPKYFIDPAASPPAPAWLRTHIDDDYFRTVCSAKLMIRTAEDAKAIDEVAKFAALKQFCLMGPYPDVQLFNPSVFENLDQLEALQIWNVHVDKLVLEKLCCPERLTDVSFSNTDFDDAAMIEIGKMINLDRLWLHHPRITDAGLQHIQKLKKLRTLYLDDCQITDGGLTNLTGLNGLVTLWLKNMQVTSDGVRELQKRLPTTQIYGP